MEKIKFSIVGVDNYIKSTDLNEYLLSIESRDVVLRIEPDNAYDPQAVEVLKDGKAIGHVRKCDLKKGLYYIISHANRGCYPAKILQASKSYRSFDAELDYDDVIPDTDYLREHYSKWHHSWLALAPVAEWVELRKCMDSMLTLLENGKADKSNMRELVDTFCNLAEYGFSSDFFDDRDKLQNMLFGSKDEGMRELADNIAKQSPLFHDEKRRYNVFGKIMKSLKTQLKNSQETFYDYPLREIERQLKIFPDHLFEVSLQKPNYLPARLYYAQVPYEQMLAFLTGIAILRFVSSGSAPYEKKHKKKRGRPTKGKLGKDALLHFFDGDDKTKQMWFDFIKELIRGKRNEDAAKVMSAAIIEGIIDRAPFLETKASYGDIGNREDYNKGLRKYEKDTAALDYYRKCIQRKRKEEQLA